MRIEYNEYNKNGSLGSLCMYPDNEHEFDIMNRIRKEIFGNKLILGYGYYFESGIILALTHETELKSLIEKISDDKIERILQLRNKNKWIRFTARMMIELWG